GPMTEPLQVVTDAGRCLLSELMLEALKRSRRPWTVELRASSSTALALASDLSLTGVARRAALISRGIPLRLDLPELPDVTLSVHRARSNAPSLRTLVDTLTRNLSRPRAAGR
ncbi:MAG: hypothetical protein ABW061_15655, partial [Polyangiaceae bacterium]